MAEENMEQECAPWPSRGREAGATGARDTAGQYRMNPMTGSTPPTITTAHAPMTEPTLLSGPERGRLEMYQASGPAYLLR
jgi:hypothetical protein